MGYTKLAQIALDYGAAMSTEGRDVLMSLKHWAGSLGSSGGKLAPAGTNWVWKAISAKTATSAKLTMALCNTIQDCISVKCAAWHIGRLRKEQNHVKGITGCRDTKMGLFH